LSTSIEALRFRLLTYHNIRYVMLTVFRFDSWSCFTEMWLLFTYFANISGFYDASILPKNCISECFCLDIDFGWIYFILLHELLKDVTLTAR